MKYGSPDLKIEIDGTDESGSDMINLSQYIDTINDVTIEAILQEGHGFGKTWVEQLWTKMKQCNAITVEGFYDDTATSGPDAVLNAIGETRKVEITWGGSKKTSFAAVITSYGRTPTKNELTRYSCTLTPTGEVTED